MDIALNLHDSAHPYHNVSPILSEGALNHRGVNYQDMNHHKMNYQDVNHQDVNHHNVNNHHTPNPSFHSLPDELWKMIILYTDFDSIFDVRSTSKHLLSLLHQPETALIMLKRISEKDYSKISLNFWDVMRLHHSIYRSMHQLIYECVRSLNIVQILPDYGRMSPDYDVITRNVKLGSLGIMTMSNLSNEIRNFIISFEDHLQYIFPFNSRLIYICDIIMRHGSFDHFVEFFKYSLEYHNVQFILTYETDQVGPNERVLSQIAFAAINLRQYEVYKFLTGYLDNQCFEEIILHIFKYRMPLFGIQWVKAFYEEYNIFSIFDHFNKNTPELYIEYCLSHTNVRELDWDGIAKKFRDGNFKFEVTNCLRHYDFKYNPETASTRWEYKSYSLL